jgi:CYTH domain-containing protein
MLDFADPKKQTLAKKRDNFIYNGIYFRLETFLSKGLTLLRVDSDDESSQIELPPFLEIVKEVTEDPKFFSVEISKKDFKIEL